MITSSQYCQNGCDEPVVMWSSLNLYEPASCCFLQRASDGSLTIVTKKNVLNFTPPRLVSTATEVDDFIKSHKLSPMADWKADSLEAMTPSTGRSPSLITSPPSTVVAFNSADFLQRQQRRLMLDKGLAIDLTLESDESSLAQNLSVEAGVVDNANLTHATDCWPATIIKADDPGSSPAAIAAHPETYPFNPLFGMFTSALRENLCKMTQNHRTFDVLKMKTERDTHEIVVRVYSCLFNPICSTEHKLHGFYAI